MPITGVLSVNDPPASTTNNHTGADPAVRLHDAAKAPPPPPPPIHDSVHLTAEAQAKALKQTGKTPEEIALALNIDVKTVDKNLQISAAPTTRTPVPTHTAKPPTAASAIFKS